MASMSSRTWAALLACGLLAVAAPAGAQDAKTRAEAKEVEKEAQALYDKGEYAEALAKYDRLDELIPLRPAQKVRAARCMEQLGRLLEAQSRYDAIAEDDSPTTNRADLDAREAAKNALGSLQRRIPKIVIQLEGVDPLLRVELTLDGEPLQQSKVGLPMQLDPGEHIVEGSLQRGKELERETASARFDAKESTTLDVPLRFGARGGKKKQDLGAAPGSGESSDYWAILKRGSSTQRTIGWVVVGVGGVVFLSGGATTLIALGVKSSLDEQCTPERQCPPAAHGDVDTYDTLQTVTTVLFLGGAAGVATGIALLATAPGARTLGSTGRPSRAAAGPSVTPWIGLGAAGVRGSF
jgi:hypothetical protein